MTIQLPPSPNLDVARLAALFNQTTNSYKYLLFQAILSLLPERYRPGTPTTLSYTDLSAEMVALAWYPAHFFKLSLGSQDKIRNALNQVTFFTTDWSLGHPKTQESLRRAILLGGIGDELNGLMRYVPTRLLAPFFVSEVSGMEDHLKNRVIEQLSRNYFDSRKPLYRITDVGLPAVEVHPDWGNYLMESYAIVSGWSAFRWIEYLQERNPNVPAVPNKIRPPANRSSLSAQADYWRSVMTESPVKCLYSGVILDPDDFVLDHFLPWSFVCHDQLWNLIPVSKQANAAKSNSLPHESYRPCFIDLQAAGLAISSRTMGQRGWNRATESYVGDLHIAEPDLVKTHKVRNGYMAAVPALMSLAQSIGFLPGWRFQTVQQ
jgi:hypothetical protein